MSTFSYKINRNGACLKCCDRSIAAQINSGRKKSTRNSAKSTLLGIFIRKVGEVSSFIKWCEGSLPQKKIKTGRRRRRRRRSRRGRRRRRKVFQFPGFKWKYNFHLKYGRECRDGKGEKNGEKNIQVNVEETIEEIEELYFVMLYWELTTEFK